MPDLRAENQTRVLYIAVACAGGHLGCIASLRKERGRYKRPAPPSPTASRGCPKTDACRMRMHSASASPPAGLVYEARAREMRVASASPRQMQTQLATDVHANGCGLCLCLSQAKLASQDRETARLHGKRTAQVHRRVRMRRDTTGDAPVPQFTPRALPTL